MTGPSVKKRSRISDRIGDSLCHRGRSPFRNCFKRHSSAKVRLNSILDRVLRRSLCKPRSRPSLAVILLW